MKTDLKPISYPLHIPEVIEFLPHRAPFLLVDRVDHIEPKGDLSNPHPSVDKVGTWVEATKGISFGEPHFQGHFPKNPVMPGVLIVEAMAQAAMFALYPYVHMDLAAFVRDFTVALCAINSAKFRRPVVPGDQMKIKAEAVKIRGTVWIFDAEALVSGQKVAEAQLMAMFSSGMFSEGKGEGR